MKTKHSYLVAAIITLTACDSFGTHQRCYPSHNDIQTYIDGLKSNDISYEMGQTKGCVIVPNSKSKELDQLRLQVFGEAPPSQFSISYSGSTGVVDGNSFEVDENARVIELLEKNNIYIKIMNYFGNEYIVWEEKDDHKIRKLLNL